MAHKLSPDLTLPQHLDRKLTGFLLGWHELEKRLGGDVIIDFNLLGRQPRDTYANRLDALKALGKLLNEASPHYPLAVQRLQAHDCYLRSLMGEKIPFGTFIKKTQGFEPKLFSESYLRQRRDALEIRLAELGVALDGHTARNLRALDEPIHSSVVGKAFLSTYRRNRKFLVEAIAAEAKFRLKIEFVAVQEYWAYWVDGNRSRFRLRFNEPNIRNQYSHTEAVQFVYHELLAHCAQMAVWARQIESGKLAKYFGLTTVHSPEQFLLEGLAQSLPLLLRNVETENHLLLCRIYLSHYRSLVNNNLHIMINEGRTIEECVSFAKRHLPDPEVGEVAAGLVSRANIPRFRSYEFVYPASFDFFIRCAENLPESAIKELLRKVYRGVYFYDGLAELAQNRRRNSKHISM